MLPGCSGKLGAGVARPKFFSLSSCTKVEKELKAP